MNITWHHDQPSVLWTIGSNWPSGWTFVATSLLGALAIGFALACSVPKAKAKKAVLGALSMLSIVALAGTVGWLWNHPSELPNGPHEVFLSKQQALDHIDDFGTERTSSSRLGSQTIGVDTSGLLAMSIDADDADRMHSIVPTATDWSDPATKKPIDDAVAKRYGLTDIDDMVRYAEHPVKNVDASNGTRYRKADGSTLFCMPVLNDMVRDAYGRLTSATLVGLSCDS